MSMVGTIAIIVVIIECFLLLVCHFKSRLLKKDSDKYFDMFALTAQWVRNNQADKCVSKYLLEKGFKRISIYGMGYLGQLLFDELNDSEVEIVYVIDRSEGISLSNNSKALRIEKTVNVDEKVDAVIVTAIRDFSNIKEKCVSQVGCPIISLEQVIYENAGM